MRIKLDTHPVLQDWLISERERTGKSVSTLIREAISEYAAARGVTISPELPLTLRQDSLIKRQRRLGRPPKYIKE